MKAIRLKTEFLTNPIGVDFQKPLLTWNCEGGIKQTAYRIVASADGVVTWDSGKVQSDAMRATYPQALMSRQRIEWSITLWDENDVFGETADAFFEMGLLHPSDWSARWISGNYSVNPLKRYPVDCFQKEFETADVKKARMYVSAC